MKGLSELVNKYASTQKINAYYGRKVAIDASTAILQFTFGRYSQKRHLSWFFYRNKTIMENGIKPIYVFDASIGTSGGLDEESIRECKELFRLLGVPVVEAAGSAQAQCVHLLREGKVDCVASENMATLAFGGSMLLRRLTDASVKKLLVKEFSLATILQELGLNMDEFIDMCILSGCDYCESIKGVGPATAIKLIKQFRCIEELVKAGGQIVFPQNWQYEEARRIFKNPQVAPVEGELKWVQPDEDMVVRYMEEKQDGCAESGIRSGCKSISKALRLSTGQMRIDNFFPIVSTTKRKIVSNATSKTTKAKQRKVTKKLVIEILD